MNSSSNYFTIVEYLLIFHAFLFGFIAGEFFSGWGDLYRRRERIYFYWPHFLWTLFGMLILIHYWWGNWPKAGVLSINIGYFYLSLIYPVVFYFISLYLFPRETNNYSKYFTDNRKFIYGLFAFLLLSNALIAKIFVQSDLVPYENYFRIAGALWFLISIIIRNENYHRYASVISLVILLIHHLRLSFAKDALLLNEIKGFSKTEYLISFYAILFGFVCFEFLHGWGQWMINRKKMTLYWVHILWTLLTFMMLMDLWWLSWSRKDLMSSNFEIFFLSIIPPLIFYFGSVILFPDFQKPENRNMRIYYFNVKNIMFATFALYFAFNILFSFYLGENELYPYENYFRLIAILMLAIGIGVNKVTYHSLLILLASIILAFHHVLVYY